MDLDFNIANQIFTQVPTVSADQTIDSIVVATRRLRTMSQDVLGEYRDVHVFRYLAELLYSEHDERKTLEEVAELVQSPLPGNKAVLRVKCVKNAIDKHLPVVNGGERRPLSVALAKEIHREIGAHNLIRGAGELQKNEAYPAGDHGNLYLSPALIAKSLATLFRNTENNLATIPCLISDREHVEKVIKIGAAFFLRFLRIHPFSNGNGRTGRVLLSMLLSGFACVPISLFGIGKWTRESYINICASGDARIMSRLVADAVRRGLFLALEHCEAVIE
jgi:fido (protein-threonine AMPylation protein)